MKRFLERLASSKPFIYCLLILSFASAVYSFKNLFDLLGSVLDGADFLATIVSIFLYLGCALIFLTRIGVYALVILGIIGMTAINHVNIYEALLYLLPGALLPDLIQAADSLPKKKIN